MVKFYKDLNTNNWHFGATGKKIIKPSGVYIDYDNLNLIEMGTLEGKLLFKGPFTELSDEDGVQYTDIDTFLSVVADFFVDAETNSPSTGTLLVSAGTAVKPNITYALGNVTVGPGTYWLYKTTNFTGGVKEYKVTSSETFYTAETGVTYYAYIDYNNGTPKVKFTQDASIINYSSNCIIYTFVCNVDFTCSIIDWDEPALGLPNKLLKRDVECRRFERAKGLEISTTASRNIHINAGIIWQGSFKNAVAEFKSEVANNNLFLRLHNTSTGIWGRTPVTTFTNTQYDNGDGTLATLTDGSYGIVWVYKSMADNLLNAHIVLGTKSYTLEEAKQAQPGLIPSTLETNDILVGRIIIKKGDTTPTQIDSAFAFTFAASSAYTVVLGSPVRLYVDNTRTDTYVPDGSLAKPFIKIGDAFTKMSGDLTKAYNIDVAPSTYTEAFNYTVPNAPFILHGNGSTFTFTSVNISNYYSIYDLHSEGTITYSYGGPVKSIRSGGSILGNVNLSGTATYTSVTFQGGNNIIVQANSAPTFAHCTIGSTLKTAASTSSIKVLDCLFSRNTPFNNIDMTAGGALIINGGVFTNNGTVSNIKLTGASTDSANPNILSSCTCNGGIECGNAYVIVDTNIISPYLTGTAVKYGIGSTNNIALYGTATSTNNTYTCTIPALLTGYTTGLEITCTPNFTNTGLSTLNVNGLGAKTIKRGNYITDSSLQVGDIENGVMCVLKYDGTYFRLMNPRTQSTTVKNNLTANAAPTVTDDVDSGYSAGSTWIYNSITYTCSDATKGAAIWVSSADLFYFDTWTALVAAISVAGSTYINKYCKVSNANGGPSSGATYQSSTGAVTNPIVDGGEATYKCTQQGTPYTVICQTRTITNPTISSIMETTGSIPNVAGYYIFKVAPTGGLPSGIVLNDIAYYNGSTWSKFQSYSAAPSTVLIGTTSSSQLLYRKQMGSWGSAAMLRGTAGNIDPGGTNGYVTVTGDLVSAYCVPVYNATGSQITLTVPAVKTNSVWLFSIENMNDEQLTNDIKPLVWTRLSNTQVRVFIEESGAVTQSIKLNVIIMI